MRRLLLIEETIDLHYLAYSSMSFLLSKIFIMPTISETRYTAVYVGIPPRAELVAKQ